MVAYTRDEIISVTELARNLSGVLGGLMGGMREKIAIMKNNKLEAVIIPIDEYERLREVYERAEDMEIARIVKERDKTPKEDYLTLEEMAESMGVNLDAL